MKCQECNEDKPIVNKHYGLCLDCNQIRLHGSKYGKPRQEIRKNPEPIPYRKGKAKGPKMQHKIGPKGLTTMDKIKLDEETYEQVFNACKNHECEECGTELNTEFRDSEGRVIDRFRYSHIFPKGANPQWRHLLLNFNNLCMVCHDKWEFGDRKSMAIYEGNMQRLPELNSKR